MKHQIKQIIEDHWSGNPVGIPSFCTAHPVVLETALQHGVLSNHTVLVEATCNQVNQFGGYTGMKPVDFVAFMSKLAQKTGLHPSKLILGGDHLGPSPWQANPAREAMDLAEELVKSFVQAGFSKIHLDCSMHLGDDDQSIPLRPEIAAERSARLAKAAEKVCPSGCEIVYVIGTEVPVPGGAKEHHGIQVTTTEAAAETTEVTRKAFFAYNLQSAWEKVIAQVVQPGVEFGDDFILDYVPEKARELGEYIQTQPGMVFEAHSTDYQTEQNLQKLVEGHFAILKVGPELTYAYREAVFGLALIERECIAEEAQSHLLDRIETVMLNNPQNWQKYYHGNKIDQTFARRYSLSDRIRYYWPHGDIQRSLSTMLDNLNKKPIPLSLLSQFFPREYDEVRTGFLPAQPEPLIRNHILSVIQKYEQACGW